MIKGHISFYGQVRTVTKNDLNLFNDKIRKIPASPHDIKFIDMNFKKNKQSKS